MPALPPARKGAKGGEEPARKKKVLPVELCKCGADMYRPPPKGKKAPAPLVHNPGCVYQRTTCDAYPHLPRCVACQNPCNFCLGKTRWCPHCYENQCEYRYKRVVLGVEVLTGANVGPGSGEPVALAQRRGTSRRRTTVKFVDGKRS
ncbi:unspecified product [Leptomonas pyrrhocoris]|uniref:Unspecified product n=1 Tax=Leptomonas pyrrhocoris TaxID=157538 RepID=A0A0M9G3S4_LEPPY|nr:unspecified product [Leptomonas pyrrhocoris]KPA81536.1 unspecified product [Leptomonas pyrrhocoris]|eukprot:XP_015659975.1 unspecified product [Leptomonas pyrrhocoris]